MSGEADNKRTFDRVTLNTLRSMKEQKHLITITTAYDWCFAKLLDEAGVDVFVVGDSLGMNVLGYTTTLPVTVDEIIHHTRAVNRGRSRAMVVADMPYLSYELDVLDGLRNASRLIKEAGADAVKLEGGIHIVDLIAKLVRAKIPTMGHLGLTPQSHLMTSGFAKLPARTETEVDRLIADAKALADAGVFAVLLECVPAPLASLIAKRHPHVIWLGLGSGRDLDGQGMVHSDLLGFPSTLPRRPRFVKSYVDLSAATINAVRSFREEVASGAFPADEHIYTVPKRLADIIEARAHDKEP
jgi:3-methyl-2-oxobutanoate hydroxymethyltransferase